MNDNVHMMLLTFDGRGVQFRHTTSVKLPQAGDLFRWFTHCVNVFVQLSQSVVEAHFEAAMNRKLTINCYVHGGKLCPVYPRPETEPPRASAES